MTLQLHENWNVEVTEEVVERSTNLQGLVGHGMSYRLAKITGKPIATSANLATLLQKLHPYKASDKGKKLSTVLGGANLPAVIQTADGRSVTFSAAFLTSLPDITFAPNTDLFGDFELTCLIAENGSFATLADYVTEAASTYTEPTLDPLTIISDRYQLSWGTTPPFDDIETTDAGIVLSASVDTAELSTQRDGLLDWRINDVTAEVKFTPVNVTSAQFTSLVTAVARGKMVGNAGLELTCEQVTGTGGPKVVAQLAVPISKSLQFGDEARTGEVTMRLERKFTTSLQERYALTVKS
jgi:hypothetical protein